MAQSGKNESKKRSRAITIIVREIGRDEWNRLSIDKKNKLIKGQIAKTKKNTKIDRNERYNLNRELRGTITD